MLILMLTFQNASSDAVCTLLDNNAYRCGFIKRYPFDKTEITGINNESWHYRYEGKANAKIMQEKGLCLEEYIASVKKIRKLKFI